MMPAMTAERDFILTKSQFKRYRECPVGLWLALFRPEWLGGPAATAAQAMMSGNEVDEVARELFPDGRLVTSPDASATALRNAEVIFQPTIVAADEGWLCQPDILRRGLGSSWDILEVKATKRVKDEHLTDVGFQALCLAAAGLNIDRLKVVHLNGDYVRHGDLVPDELFTISDVTRRVRELLPALKEEMRRAVRTVSAWRGTERADALLHLCENPDKCEHAKLLNKGGVQEQVDIVARPELGQVVDERRLRYVLGSLRYPLHYLDYETYLPAVPWYDGYRPYEPVPFQFSLDVEMTPGGTVTHHEFLARQDLDPTPDLVAALRHATHDEGQFVAWHAPFEKSRNDDIARREPQHAAFLHDVNRRMFDLMLLFKRRGGVLTHPDFHGSASLKAVVPALLGDRYGALDIHEGGMAMAAWPELIGRVPRVGRRSDLQRALLDYCGLDTMVMVEIMRYLRTQAP
jgi:hypothetical protein